jgi:MFS family permease
MTLRWHRVSRDFISQHTEGWSTWTVVILLFLFMLINFADKVVLALAGIPVMEEFSLTPTQFGLLGSSFFLLFSVSAVVTGFIVNHVQSRWAILTMALVWSLAQFSVIGAGGFGLLMTSRIILGAGEGPAYPVALHSVYKWFCNKRRAIPTAIVSAGALVGLVVAPPALTYVITHVSWRWAYGLLGLMGLLWALAWLAFGAEGGQSVAPQQSDNDAYVPYLRLLFNGTALAAFASGFAAYWGVALLFTWFTPYLVNGLGFSPGAAGWLTSLPSLCSLIVLTAGAWVSQAALSQGTTTRVARGMLTGAAALLGGLAMMLTPLVTESAAKVGLISLGIELPAMIFVLGHPMIAEFTPVPQRGAMLAITNSIWTAAGVLVPYVMGRVIEGGATVAQGYEHGFIICGVITSACGVVGLIFLRPEGELRKFSSGARGSLAVTHVAQRVVDGR